MSMMLNPMYGMKLQSDKECIKMEAAPQEVPRPIVTLIVLNKKMPELITELREGQAIMHPMFPGVHCVVTRLEIKVRLENYCICLIQIAHFVKDDGK